MVDKLTIQEIKESLTAVAMSKRLRKYHPDEPVTHTVVQRDRIKRLFDSYIPLEINRQLEHMYKSLLDDCISSWVDIPNINVLYHNDDHEKLFMDVEEDFITLLDNTTRVYHHGVYEYHHDETTESVKLFNLTSTEDFEETLEREASRIGLKCEISRTINHLRDHGVVIDSYQLHIPLDQFL